MATYRPSGPDSSARPFAVAASFFLPTGSHVAHMVDQRLLLRLFFHS